MEYSFNNELNLSDLKCCDVIKFNCQNCGQEISIQKRKFTIPLCRKCKLQKKRSEGAYDNVANNMRATIAKKYGSQENYNEIQSKKRKENCVKKYGKDNYFQTDEFKNKRRSTLEEKYGSMEEYEKHRLEKAEATFKEHYDISKGEFLHNAFVEKHNVDNPRYLQSVKDKIKSTCLDRYGATSPLGNKEINKQCHETFIKKYGCKSTLSFSETRNKTKETMMQKYGVLYPGSSPELMKNRWSHYDYDDMNFDSSWELAYYIWLKDSRTDFQYHPNISFKFSFNGKEHCCIPDFKIGDKYIEIKGAHFINENGTWKNPFKKELDDLYEAKRQCLLQNNVEIITDCEEQIEYVKNKYGKDFFLRCKNSNIDELAKECSSKPFPYYQKKENMTYLEAIRFFHKSIWTASKKGLPAPIDIWKNENMMRNVIKNRLRYNGYIDEAVLRRGICVYYKAKVSVFSPSLAIDLIEKYLSDTTTIFDPFSGFSGRMIATESLGKHYIGQDINEEHINESKQIAEYFEFKPELKIQDALTDSNKEFEYLFTCPPYGRKEHWNENNDLIEKSCDEWIDVCLEKYRCKKYLFVVDFTDKYKDYVVDNIDNRDMYGSNTEKIILIER